MEKRNPFTAECLIALEAAQFFGPMLKGNLVT